MKSAGRQTFWSAVMLGASQLLAASLLAQAPAQPPVSAPTNAAVRGSRAAGPPPLPTALPPLPPPKPPVEFFRELLAMTPGERQKALADRAPESRKIILAKAREYASLDPDQRELRLQVTELQYYLLPMMTGPSTNRPTQLAAVPPRERPLVDARLQEWDKLPTDVQRELLANQATIRYFTEIEGQTDEQRRRILEGLSPARRQKLQEGIDKWNSLPADQRARMLDRFTQFFELTADDKEKALRTLSGPERRQIQKTLRTFGSLPPDQRAQCVRGFEKFASLSVAERQQFLKSAERWQLMTPKERQAWRDLVSKLPTSPPMPPDLPPMPPVRPTPRPAAAVATNGN